ncbi:MAG: VIT domain-containing protein, partial [Gammaproteobacteria bacterium]
MQVLRIDAIVRVLTLILLIFPPSGFSGEGDDQTLSPYFQVVSENPGAVETLPLESTSADVNIAGVIADVRVKQVYRNRGQTPIDAVYVFPGSTRAAVHGLQMQIGERRIHAKIKERQSARAEFKRAKSEGKRVSLLEQQRPNVFQMNVANILPGDRITVELRYTEIMIPEKGTYEFVYPAVVGPRYSETPAANAPDQESWVANPYLPEGQAAPYAFDIQVSLSTGIPIQGIHSPSHAVDVRFESQGRARIGLKGDRNHDGNRDYILQYRLQGEKIESGLLLQEGEEENFFLLMTQPPERVRPEQIPPREYIFVVDVSGSMHGFPLDTAKELMKALLEGLRPMDRFNILFFSGGSSVLSETSVPATPENMRSAFALLENLEGSGGTELLPALQRAMAFRPESGTARSFVIVTDGYVSVETEAFDYVRGHLDQA